MEFECHLNTLHVTYDLCKVSSNCSRVMGKTYQNDINCLQFRFIYGSNITQISLDYIFGIVSFVTLHYRVYECREIEIILCYPVLIVTRECTDNASIERL